MIVLLNILSSFLIFEVHLIFEASSIALFLIEILFFLINFYKNIFSLLPLHMKTSPLKKELYSFFIMSSETPTSVDITEVPQSMDSIIGNPNPLNHS